VRRILLTLVLVLLSATAYSQTISIGEDAIVRCKDVPIGTKQTVAGTEYEVVDRNLLIQRRNEEKDLTKVCVTNVTDMSGMFGCVNSYYNSREFDQNFNNWDVSNVTNMSGMFACTGYNQPIDNWDVSKVTDMSGMFAGSRFNQPIGNWDVSNVTDMSFMFRRSNFNQPIGNWDVSNVTVMGSMFWGNTNFNQNISNWDVSNVTNMSYMFAGYYVYDDLDDDRRTDYYTSFNQSIGNWDVSSVTDMGYMFNLSKFNQPINTWCVSQFDSEPVRFSTYSPLTTQNKPIWGTCPSTNDGDDTVRDIEGKVYRTVQIGNQRWMAQNLRTSRYNDGTSIPEITLQEPVAWSTNTTGAWSFYDDDSANNSPYGKLYNYYVVQNSKNVCPTGWSVPTDSDWAELHEYLGDDAGNKLKSTTRWADNGNGTNESGFDAIGSGRKGSSGTSYTDLNKVARFWTATQYNANNGVIYRLTYDSDELQRDFNSKNNAFSIRCISNTRPTSLEDNTITLPQKVDLQQNYPNPFNPTTQIRFALPESQQVTIQVYDVNGRLVAELLNNAMYSAGNHHVRLMAPDYHRESTSTP
jgi:uncharacterized protein (TIGR02145 family)